VLFEYGKYFWEQKDSHGIRKKPIEAIDLLRSAYRLDPTLFEAAGLLTVALVYRFLNGEKDEFLEKVDSLMDELNKNAYPRNMVSAYYLILTCLELKRFGIQFVSHEELTKLKAYLSLFPASSPYRTHIDEVERSLEGKSRVEEIVAPHQSR